MLSDQAYEALGKIDSGYTMNPIHTVSRELINAGLACNDWGRLALTESGRRVVRGARSIRSRYTMANYPPEDANVTELIHHQDPFTTPKVSHPLHYPEPADQYDPPAATETVLLEEPNPDRYTLALRCAGVATGKTGIEVDAAWAIAFIEAWVNL
jgi:hypothetical protein